MRKHKILCVDDEIDNVEALERLFRKKYEIVKATSAHDALQWLDQNPEPLALIITDQRMPEMTGVEFLEKTLTSRPDTLRILLTGYTDLESVISAVNQGQIYRYLTKPWDPLDLTNTVDHAIERYILSQELKQKNVELENALSELQTLDRAKSNFMILINHELKTPLTSILNFGSLLTETKLDEDQSKYLQRIQKSAERLKELVDDVLLIMKAETNQIKLDKNTISTKNILDKIQPQVQNDLAKKSQKIKLETTLESFEASDLIFTQVLNRLVLNASKFGSADQTFSLEIISKPMNHVQFRLSNSGPQISETVIEKIFKPFYIDENIMNHSTGRGLGLTVCQSLLRLIDSGINIKNNNNGVTVYFDL